MKRKGFTFIELLIVIVIIGILTGMVMPKLKTAYNNFQMDSFVKNVYYLAKYLQASAIYSRQVYRLDIVEDENGQYFLAKYKSDEGEFANIKGRFAKPYMVPQGVTISLEPQDKTSIFFYPDGSIDETKVIYRDKADKEIVLVFKGSGTDIEIK